MALVTSQPALAGLLLHRDPTMRCHLRWLMPVCLSVTAALVSLSIAATSARAQAKVLHAGEGPDRLVLDKEWPKDAPEEFRLFQALRRGDPSASASPEVIDHAAQWFAYRFTHAEYQEPKLGGQGMHTLFKEAQEQIVNSRDRSATATQQAFMEAFGPRFTARLQEVVKNPKAIARLNAVMLLAQLAAAGQEEAADVLAEVIADSKENDGIKLHAFRGLRDFFALGQGDNPTPFKTKEKEARCIAALLDYLSRRPAGRRGADPKEVAALHYVRAEAIAALGQTRYPAVARTVEKKTVIERPTALTLLRVIRKDGVTPPPSLKEQVNAVVALCQLQAHALRQYNPDYAAHHIGRFLVDFFTQDNSRKPQAKGESWKLDAARLLQALAAFRADTEDLRPAGKYVDSFVRQAEPLLHQIIEGKMPPDPTRLRGWLDANTPRPLLYEGMESAVVRESRPRGE
jgi:hypothetical protein